MRVLVVEVPGTPAPQGSKRIGRHGTRPIVIDDNPAALTEWRNRVAFAVRVAAARTGWRHDPDTGLHLHVDFTLHPPRRRRHELPVTRPDLDKLLRAVGDALTTAGAVSDDSRITTITATKRYAGAGRTTGAVIMLQPDRPAPGRGL